MVPDKFNMVDMEGIDLIESQGVEVPGLYEKLVESIALCRYQCLYNWKFNGIIIPPSYVEMEVRAGGVWINEGVMVDENDVVHVNATGPAPVEPVIQPIEIIENGTYIPDQGVDGYSPVTVNVVSSQPVIESIEITENGTYTAPAGTDGYSPIVVNVSGDFDPIQSNIQVSSGSAYMSYTFPVQMEFESFDCILITISHNNSIVAAGALKYASGDVVFYCSGDLEYTMRISDNSIACTRYSGAYKPLFANIYGINF